jgi:hypothetical protein
MSPAVGWARSEVAEQLVYRIDERSHGSLPGLHCRRFCASAIVNAHSCHGRDRLDAAIEAATERA